MSTIRKALDPDREAVFRILKELDLEYPGLTFDHFWVAESEGRVAAAARLQEFGDFCFLSAVGTAAAEQGRGIGRKLVQTLLQECGKEVYLYTIIPAFFLKLGFEPATGPGRLPERGNFNCETCEPEKCVRMRWKPE